MNLLNKVQGAMWGAILQQTKQLLKETAKLAYEKGYSDCAAGTPADITPLLVTIERGVERGKPQGQEAWEAAKDEQKKEVESHG